MRWCWSPTTWPRRARWPIASWCSITARSAWMWRARAASACARAAGAGDDQEQLLSRLLGATQVPEPAAPKAQARHAAPRETTAQEASPLQRIPAPRVWGSAPATIPAPARRFTHRPGRHAAWLAGASPCGSHLHLHRHLHRFAKPPGQRRPGRFHSSAGKP
ncbi:hypothetical protein XACM_3110 [Xanthomonas euvesicatoria pv. citrumelo F1]|nr:hypothetical protein XACM_3110 [Xanthomonas euvesicatoria pv. citrumelo F1]